MRGSRRLLLAALAMILAGAVFWYITKHEAGTGSRLDSIRIGWQPPLATQGQLVQVLKNTDILEKNGFKAEFEAFNFGGPQVEAAAAGQLDVIFVGDQPAINLVVRGAQWKLISQLFDTRVTLMVPPGSKLTADELRGKTVASPFGSVAHREATFIQRASGLDPKRDVKNVNLDIVEINALVRSGKEWKGYDAVAVWEPSGTQFSAQGLARPIAEARTLGVVAASNAFLEKGDQAARLEKAIREAWQFLVQNPELANEWYRKDTGLNYAEELLMSILRFDRNGALIPATGSTMRPDIDRITNGFTSTDKCALDRAIQWANDQGMTDRPPDVSPFLYNAPDVKCVE